MSQRKIKDIDFVSNNDENKEIIEEYKKLNDICDDILRRKKYRNLKIRESHD